MEKFYKINWIGPETSPDLIHYCLAYTLDEYRIINTYVRRFSGKLEDDGIICYLRDFDMYYWKVEEITKEEYFIEII